MSLNLLLEETKDIRAELNQHSVYATLNNVSDIRHFMQYHVFAVWDFMSLVKYLQNKFTSTTLPWTPPKNPTLARFINDIILAEESDVMPNGVAASHFEMYLMAMEELNADTSHIRKFVNALDAESRPITTTIKQSGLDECIQDFLNFTFSTIASGKDHCVAAAFAFGREDIIPEMFMKVIEGLSDSNQMPVFKYYLERHIELDGDEHGPLALEMMNTICGNDTQKWKEATQTAIEALEHRVLLWTSIELRNPRLLSNAY